VAEGFFLYMKGTPTKFIFELKKGQTPFPHWFFCDLKYVIFP
jgi:hypothetical protein